MAAPEHEIAAALDRYYGEHWDPQPPETDDQVVVHADTSAVDVRDEEAERSAVNIVERLIARAAADGASDIHLDPAPDVLGVRFRIDGGLRDVTTFPGTFAPAVLSRVKVLGGMDIAERRLPQDGRFSATFLDRRIDVRAATYPTLHGERAVLRLLDQSALRVAAVKGSLAACYFMHLISEKKLIYAVLVLTDVLRRAAGASGGYPQQRLLDSRMNLRWFHAPLILLSAALAVLFVVWCLTLYGRQEGIASLLGAIAAFAVAVGDAHRGPHRWSLRVVPARQTAATVSAFQDTRCPPDATSRFERGRRPLRTPDGS